MYFCPKILLLLLYFVLESSGVTGEGAGGLMPRGAENLSEKRKKWIFFKNLLKKCINLLKSSKFSRLGRKNINYQVVSTNIYWRIPLDIDQRNFFLKSEKCFIFPKFGRQWERGERRIWWKFLKKFSSYATAYKYQTSVSFKCLQFSCGFLSTETSSGSKGLHFLMNVVLFCDLIIIFRTNELFSRPLFRLSCWCC